MPPGTNGNIWAAWAKGGPRQYNKPFGLPFGGPTAPQWYFLQIHYNNPQHVKGVMDGSGYDIYFVEQDNLRETEIGILFLDMHVTQFYVPANVQNYQQRASCDCSGAWDSEYITLMS